MLDKTPLHMRVDRTLLDLWRKILLDGADYLDRHGWVQKCMIDEATGAVCARGAILGALTGGKMTSPEIQKAWQGGGVNIADNNLAGYLTRIVSNGEHTTVPMWNDKVAKTKAEVVNTMRACALEGVDQY